MTLKDKKNKSFPTRVTPEFLTCTILIVIVFSIYFQVQNHEFVNFDDDSYVTANPYVQDGLSINSLAWSFTFNKFDGHWHPLTWQSHMLDYEIAGLSSAWHHMTNVFIHLLNALLLFFVLKKITGGIWQSAFVAALFAAHPLNVESVAWVAERKNVLSTFFWILTIGCYAGYSKRPGAGRYAACLGVYLLGLMAKPMLVTLPFVLLLLDYWPLGRLRIGQFFRNSSSPNGLPAFRLILEKIPFFILAGASCVVTYIAMQRDGILGTFEQYSLGGRISNALVTYVVYLVKMIWPSGLAVIYPHPGFIPLWQAAGAFLVLLIMCFTAFLTIRSRPYIVVGWLWYLGTLVPVIGLVQVGLVSRADRHTYVPLIGIFIVVAWFSADLSAQWRYRKKVLSAVSAIVLIFLMTVAWMQVDRWSNSVSLWQHVLSVTERNHVAHNCLGVALAQQGSITEASTHFREVLKIKPDKDVTHNNLGKILTMQGKNDEAMQHFTEALRINPGNINARNNLAIALAGQGKTAEAINHFKTALQIEPDNAETHNNLGIALSMQGTLSEAVMHYTEALRINPGYAEAHYNLGVDLAALGRIEEAIVHYREALIIRPDYIKARKSLGEALAAQKRINRTP